MLGKGGRTLGYGSSTASMTWMTPFETSMSAATIRASLTYGTPARMDGWMKPLLSVRMRVLSRTFALKRSPGATW